MCEHRWTGLNTSHCAACHETFTSLTPFDAHQRLQDGRVACLNPHTALDSAGRQMFRRKPGSGYWQLDRHDEMEAPQWRS